jgi:hypothetical protein
LPSHRAALPFDAFSAAAEGLSRESLSCEAIKAVVVGNFAVSDS